MRTREEGVPSGDDRVKRGACEGGCCRLLWDSKAGAEFPGKLESMLRGWFVAERLLLCSWDQALSDTNWCIYTNVPSLNQLGTWLTMCINSKPSLFHISFLLILINPCAWGNLWRVWQQCSVIFLEQASFWEGVKQCVSVWRLSWALCSSEAGLAFVALTLHALPWSEGSLAALGH